MEDYFDRARQFVSVAEGGANFNVIDGKPVLKQESKNDTGGPTKYGITWKTLEQAYKQKIVSHNDIINLTKDEAVAIYKANYWIASKSDKIEWGLCLVHFDTAINSGVGAAGKMLQETLNKLGSKLTVDGLVGPKTLAEIGKYKMEDIIKTYCDRRRSFYNEIVRKNPKQKVFLNGWLGRVDKVQKAALS